MPNDKYQVNTDTKTKLIDHFKVTQNTTLSYNSHLPKIPEQADL
jgi:hypothetical protein